ncbi:MAG TPA: protein kinase [Planctomycetota bacterium]|nr:protein kinase [Planctomycetota bacterium]
MIDRDSQDLFLGKKALDRKLISPTQLREAMSEQARSRTPSGSRHVPLGEVFVARSFMSRDQLLALLEETARITGGTPQGRDSVLGRLLIENRTITPEHLQECLGLQDEAIRAGENPGPRLGELLVVKGYATPEAVRLALATQEKTILSCTACGKRCNGAGYDPARKYRCPACKAELKPSAAASDVSVQEATQEVPLADSGGTTVEAPSVTAPTPTPSSRVSTGKYTIVREVGRGGMGIVYEALDTVLDRKVALKMLMVKPHPDAKEAGIDEERFLREARVTAQLPHHPHVVGIYEAGILDGSRYIAMEFINGVSMLEWWKDKTLRLRSQVAVLRDAALGVHHAHEHGVVHRDLKPENILIDTAGQPHITDFGLAKDLQQSPKDALTGKGMVVGSPHYMSPEQVRGIRVDRRTDVYSLGVILYEMFTGRRPFEGGSPEEVMLKALKSTAPSPSSVMRSQMNPVLHRSLENVCLKAIARDRNERYQTAKAMAEDLTRWLGGEEVEADLPQRRRRRRMILGAAGAAAAILIGGLAWVLVTSSTERELASAARLVVRGDYAAALSLYDRVLQQHPGHAEALAGKEDIRKRQNALRLEEAAKLMEQRRYSEALNTFMLVLVDDPQERRAQEGKEEARRRLSVDRRPQVQ